MRTWWLVAGLVSIGCQEKKPPPPQARPPAHVKVAKLAATDVSESSEYIATIKSRNSVVLQPQIAGHITEIFVKSGESVKAGAAMLQVDPMKQQAAFYSSSAATEIVRADLERARATLTSLTASRSAKASNLAFAEQQQLRSAALLKSNAISQHDFDQTANALETARADLASLEAQIGAQKASLDAAGRSLQQAQAVARTQQVELQYYKVVAPFDGVVGDIPVKVGDYVTPATRLTTVDQNSGLEAYISVPIEHAARLKNDLAVHLLGSDGRTIAESRIYFVSPEINEETQSILVKSKLEKAPPDVRTAQFVRARVVWSTHPGVRIPITAVSRMNGQPFVYVTDAAKEGAGFVVHQTAVTLGPIEGSEVAVEKGLKPNDQIVVSGLQKLGDGAPIVIDP